MNAFKSLLANKIRAVMIGILATIMLFDAAYALTPSPPVKLNNPFGGINSLQDLIITGIPAFLVWIVGPLFLVYFLISAVKYLFSAANPQAVTDAKNGMLYAGLGLVMVLGAYAVVRFLEFLI